MPVPCSPTSRPPTLRSALLAGVLVGALVAPPALAAEDAASELEQTQIDLEHATTQLEQLQGELDHVEAEVVAADTRLAQLQDGLDLVEAELADADQAVLVAEEELAASRSAAAQADATFRAAQQRWRDARAQLEARVAAMWIHGNTAAADVLMEGLLTADTLHELAVARQASRNLLDHDQLLVGETIDAAAHAAELRAEAEADQAAMERATRLAHAARNHVAELVVREQRLVRDAAAQREARAAALRRIEQDAAARAALIDRLEARVEELRVATLDQWLQEIAQLPFDGPAPAWAGGLPRAGQPLAAAIDAAAARAGVDGRLLAALVWTESTFRPSAVSPSGAVGLTQLMPPTAGELGVDAYDPLANLSGGARYLRQQLDRFGRVDLALAAYNAGPQRVVDAGFAVPEIVETQLYVLRILDRWERLA